ncbi:sensor histidine kinase [Amycolatopsis vancoresmycina]|uniref:Integral membrane sensor signal transduction histidine kinase n=1 Tax=Amycolatopsis vancoresmycina DSM 44592 TaxID=1292037 RepID=R1FXW9_9PSEU|nr:histidine kinase [Amycolatopsis vancoresmycina]EOD64167.1 integral membrane sensor signal transduction histidine kinase [Amycolatopsis vancoresmycina DSM 44592]
MEVPTIARRTSWTGGKVQERLRRLNLITTVPPLALVGVFLLLATARSWWHVVIQVAGLLAALATAERWTAGDYLRVARPSLAVTAVVWLAGSLTDDTAAFFGLSVVGSYLIPPLPRRRLAALAGLTVLIAGLGAANVLVHDDRIGWRLFQFAAVPAAAMLVSTAFMFVSQRFFDLIAELEQSRDREADLAVTRERVRFASDLHDIQGHTLHVVKLKVALAEKLLDREPDRAREELREVHDLVGDTIVQTRELAYAQRRLNLSAELENAKNLFEAAGIHVRVTRESEVDTTAGELLGQVLRETTTNILRHAEARQVGITLSRRGIAIVNDGAPDTGPLELGGLAVLRHRLAEHGAELEVSHSDGRFRTAAAFPAPKEARR